jgi:hypothetical protein
VLSVRSIADFPRLLEPGAWEHALSAREKQAWEAVRGPGARTQWLLTRLVAKELSQRFCSSHWGFVPELATVELVPKTRGGLGLHFVAGSGSAPQSPLGHCESHSGDYAAACIRLARPGQSFGVCIQRIEPSFPFLMEERFTERELSWLRDLSDSDKPSAHSAVLALKEAVGKAVTPRAAGLEGMPEVRRLLRAGESEVWLGASAVAALGGEGQVVVRARVWFFENHVLAFGAVWGPPSQPPDPFHRLEENPVLKARRLSVVG